LLYLNASLAGAAVDIVEYQRCRLIDRLIA
jgi:hypothetical protein